jgi:hypothetical protein
MRVEEARCSSYESAKQNGPNRPRLSRAEQDKMILNIARALRSG